MSRSSGGARRPGGPGKHGGATKKGARAGSPHTSTAGGGLLGGVFGAAKTGGGPSVRRQRLAGTIHKHLSGELGRHLTDPRLAAVGIERVELSPDLSIAKVYVRLVFGDIGPGRERAALAALAGAGPGLRASLGPLLRMRRVPELRFHYDVGAEHRAHIEGLLAEIANEDEDKRRELEASGAPLTTLEDEDESDAEGAPDDEE